MARYLTMYVNKTKIREYFKQAGMASSEKAFEQIDQTVEVILREAVVRSKKNRRRTVLQQDI